MRATRPLTQNMRNFLNRASVAMYGESMDDTQEKLQEARSIIESNQNALKSKDDALKSKEEVLRKSILKLHQKMNLGAEEIAETLELDIDFVTSVLNEK